MTTTVDQSAARPATTAEPVLRADPLGRCLAAALDAADAADVLRLDSQPLRAAHATGLRRVGFPGDAYVLALVGGTGVGKSSLLNALAGGVVSAASVRRPTTSEPIAWVPHAEHEALEPLLDWLGVDETREYDASGLGPLAILDLPDMDSVATSHRDRVETLLPLVDAVAWVTDPEKYADAVLHDDFLRSWLPRLGRQIVLLNKADRLAPGDARRIRRDLEADLASGAIRGSDVAVLVTSAISSGGTDDLQAWLSSGAESKRVVRERIAASIAAAARDLAWTAGEGRAGAGKPFLDAATREAATRAASEAVLRAVDVAGLERQVVAATQAAARARGTGPLGRVTSFVYRASGRETAVADPNRYLLRWRERASLGPAIEAIREAISGPIRHAPPAIRPALAGSIDPVEVRRGLERGVDRAIRDIGHLEPPTSRVWPLLGLLQTVASAGIALSAAWVVVWLIVRPETGSIVLPVLGPVPSPFAALVASLLVGYVLARLVGVHARRLGSRAAARVRDRITVAVEREVRGTAFDRLDELDAARTRLASALDQIDRWCAAAR
ncbi:MAG TPA: GTPase [Candidatus Limnocylindrales bacterium]|nr:GTPase [Candidatus Limnocylindrales bacterium]